MMIFRKSSLAAVFAAWPCAGNNAFADGDLQFLWWGVGDPGQEVDVVLSEINLQNPDGTSAGTAYSRGVNAARVRVVELDKHYLNTAFTFDPSNMYEPPDDPFEIPFAALANITSFASSSPEYHFVVELGNWGANGEWTHVADSESKTYEQLGYYVKTFSNEKWESEPMGVWRPTTYVVPEPSGGLLVLLGAAGLLLRRGRKFRA